MSEIKNNEWYQVSRRVKGQIQSGSNAHSRKRFRRLGKKTATQPIRGCRKNRTQRNSPRYNSRGESVTGGILRQLVEEYESQISTKLAEIQRLEMRIAHFQGLIETIEESDPSVDS